MSINKNEPAFPEMNKYSIDMKKKIQDIIIGVQLGRYTSEQAAQMICMDKRFYAACAAMQGLLAGRDTKLLNNAHALAEKAFDYADALLEYEEYLKQKQ